MNQYLCSCLCVRVRASERACACVMVQREGMRASVAACVCLLVCMYVCKRDCVILHFKLAIFENIICSNLEYYIHLDNC